MASSSPRSRLLVFYGITVLFFLVFFLVIAELLVRIQGAYATWTEKSGGVFVSSYMAVHDSWYFTHGPNATFSYNQPEFDYDRSTNSEGLRGPDVPQAKPAGEYRILLLGDSFAEGQGAPLERTVLSTLVRSLNAESYKGLRYRGIPGGMVGSDPFFCYVLLRDRLLKYGPDLVLLMVNESDMGDIIGRGGMERFHEDGRMRGPHPPAIEGLFARSHLARFFLIKVLGYDWRLLSPSDQDETNTNAQIMIAELAREFEALGDKHGFEFMLIFHPLKHEVVPDAPPIYPHAKRRLDELNAATSKNDIVYGDVTPAMRAAFGEPFNFHRMDDLYWPVDNHYTGEGYEVVARAVESFLKENQVL